MVIWPSVHSAGGVKGVVIEGVEKMYVGATVVDGELEAELDPAGVDDDEGDDELAEAAGSTVNGGSPLDTAAPGVAILRSLSALKQV